MSRGIIFITIAVAISIAIPISLYLTYPVDEYEVVEQAVKHIYSDIPQRVPRFVPGVVGYISFSEDAKFSGILIPASKGLSIIKTIKGEYVPVILMYRYRCVNDSISIVFGEELNKFLGNRFCIVIGRVFRTPRGLVIVPREIRFEGVRCTYLKH